MNKQDSDSNVHVATESVDPIPVPEKVTLVMIRPALHLDSAAPPTTRD